MQLDEKQTPEALPNLCTAGPRRGCSGCGIHTAIVQPRGAPHWPFDQLFSIFGFAKGWMPPRYDRLQGDQCDVADCVGGMAQTLERNVVCGIHGGGRVLVPVRAAAFSIRVQHSRGGGTSKVSPSSLSHPLFNPQLHKYNLRFRLGGRMSRVSRDFLTLSISPYLSTSTSFSLISLSLSLFLTHTHAYTNTKQRHSRYRKTDTARQVLRGGGGGGVFKN